MPTDPLPTQSAAPFTIPAITDETTSTVLFSHQPSLEMQDIRSAFLSGDGQRLIIEYCENTIESWDWVSSTHATYKVDAPVSEFLLQMRGESLLFVGYNLNTEADIWLLTYQPGQETPTDETILSFPDRWINAAALSDDGKMLAIGYNLGRIHLIGTLTGKVTADIEGFNDWVTFLKFSPDGSLLMADSFSFDPHTYVIDAKTDAGSQLDKDEMICVLTCSFFMGANRHQVGIIIYHDDHIWKCLLEVFLDFITFPTRGKLAANDHPGGITDGARYPNTNPEQLVL